MQARRLESELDTKLASYAKLCSNLDAGWGSKGESGLATEQVIALTAAFHPGHGHTQGVSQTYRVLHRLSLKMDAEPFGPCALLLVSSLAKICGCSWLQTANADDVQCVGS